MLRQQVNYRMSSNFQKHVSCSYGNLKVHPSPVLEWSSSLICSGGTVSKYRSLPNLSIRLNDFLLDC